MNVLDKIIPIDSLDLAEEDILFEIFSNPIVKKYLRILGSNASKELLSLPILDETPESLVRKHTLVSGKLAVITTLLSISELQNEHH